MRIATLTFVGRLNLPGNAVEEPTARLLDTGGLLCKKNETAARTEKCDARRVGVLKVRRASRCGALNY